MLTGADFDAAVLAQLLESQGIVSLEQIGGSAPASKGSPPASPPKQPPAEGQGKRKGKKGGKAAQNEESKEPAACQGKGGKGKKGGDKNA